MLLTIKYILFLQNSRDIAKFPRLPKNGSIICKKPGRQSEATGPESSTNKISKSNRKRKERKKKEEPPNGAFSILNEPPPLAERFQCNASRDQALRWLSCGEKTRLFLAKVWKRERERERERERREKENLSLVSFAA